LPRRFHTASKGMVAPSLVLWGKRQELVLYSHGQRWGSETFSLISGPVRVRAAAIAAFEKCFQYRARPWRGCPGCTDESGLLQSRCRESEGEHHWHWSRPGFRQRIMHHLFANRSAENNSANVEAAQHMGIQSTLRMSRMMPPKLVHLCCAWVGRWRKAETACAWRGCRTAAR
jgi:hypothetical protein